MSRPTLTLVLARLVLLCLFVFASCGANWTWTRINGSCPSSCLCSVDDSSLAVGNCSRENIDQEVEQLSQQIDSLLSSNLTYSYLTHGHLAQLWIPNTPIRHLPLSICRLSTLQGLYLFNNQLTQLPDNCFINLTALTSLSAEQNRITKLQVGVFDGLHKLEKLYLNNNDITELQDGIFDRLRMLKILQLNNNRISSIGLRTFDGLSKLEGLNLQSNNITELQDGIFDTLRMLQVLVLNSNCISSIGLHVFDELSKLQVLNLRTNRITQLHDGIFDGLRMLKTLDVSDNRISSIGSRMFGGSAMKHSLNYVNLSANRIQTLESWPIYMGINQTVKVDLSDNNIHRFTNMMRWKENCGMRKVHFDLLLERNPITVPVSDLLRGWDMNISSTWCSSPLMLESYSVTINYVYFDCECVDFIIFSLRLSADKYKIGTVICNNRSLILNQDNTVPLDQFVCELTERCPSGCRCVHRPANVILHIYCNNTNLTVLPFELPQLPNSYTKYILDFSNNQLRRLEHRDYFINSSILDVSNSNIQLVRGWSDILKIPQVNLYGNKLTSFPQLISSLNITTAHLNVARNPWDCSCRNEWMSGWLNSIAERLTVDAVCHSPPRLYGKSIIRTKEKEFCIDPAAEAFRTAWLISLLSVAGVVVVLLSVIVVFYRLRVKLYTRWKVHPFDRDECPGEDMDYDVFLCFSSLDDEAIGLRILDSIEAKGYRVCYHERDFMPGLILHNIEASVAHSERTVCILTSNFIGRFVYVFLLISLFCGFFD